MEHSKEPWRRGIRYNSIVSDDSSGPMVNGAEAVEHYGGYMVAESAVEANARRIVACVNACAGLDTEYLETVGLPEFVGKTLCADLAQKELDRVVAQRDELLAVLEGLLDEVAGCMCTHEMPARAVIQKVRGGE